MHGIAYEHYRVGDRCWIVVQHIGGSYAVAGHITSCQTGDSSTYRVTAVFDTAGHADEGAFPDGFEPDRFYMVMAFRQRTKSGPVGPGPKPMLGIMHARTAQVFDEILNPSRAPD